MKEGVVEDPDNREAVLKLLRFASTASEGSENVTLKQYIERMPEGQKAIYYLIAGSREAAMGSPYLEGLKKKNVEVLLLWDRIDEWMMGSLTEFEGKKFISATAADLSSATSKQRTANLNRPLKPQKRTKTLRWRALRPRWVTVLPT